MVDFTQHFKAPSGFDAGNGKIINVATADKTVKTDAVNVDFFITHNGIQQYDPTRGYDQYHAVIYQNRAYYAKRDIVKPAGEFDSPVWQALRSDPNWEYISVTSGSTPLKVGDYIACDTQFASLTFEMPTTPQDGDTITIKDIGGKCGVNELSFLAATAHEFYYNGVTFAKKWYCTTPYSMVYFIFSRNRWHVYQTGTQPRGIYAEPSRDGLQTQNGDRVFRRSSLGAITMILPKVANNGDLVETIDLDRLTPINHVTIKVHPDAADQHLERHGIREIQNRRTGHSIFIFDSSENLWRVWDGDQSTRMVIVRSNSNLMPNTYVAVYGEQGDNKDVELTLPHNVEIGDRIQVSMNYMYGSQKCKILTGSPDVKILMNKNMIQFPKRSEYPPIDDWESFSELTFQANIDYVPYIEFSYVENRDGENYWMVCHAHPIVERVDPNRRDRIGVIALGTQAEVNKNHEENPNDEVAVTPRTLANKTATETRRGLARIATQAETHQNTGSNFLDDVIVTPKKLNSCVATEERRGVLEIATQAETNHGEDDTRAITPKKLENRRASETLAGIAEIVETGGRPASSRTVNDGTGIYNRQDHAKIVTPENLSEMKATENSLGLGFLATTEETLGATAQSPQNALFVTVSTLAKRVATEDRTGIAEIATQVETNQGQDDTRIVTPLKLNNRRATETLHGLAEIATQDEFNAGADDARIATTLKIKTFLSQAQRFRVDGNQGLRMEGNIWSGITVHGLDATETVKGVAKIATTQLVDAGADNTTIVTPAKLHGKKSSETKEGIIRVATQAETVAGTLANVAVSPKNLKHVVQVENSWQSEEQRRGFVKIATTANCFVGNNTDGSTQAVDQYQHNGIAVSPKGLNTALANFLPKMATAQNSLKLGNVVAANWTRRDIDQTLKGNITLEKDLNVSGDVTGSKSASFNTLYVTKNSTEAPSNGYLVLGQRGSDGHSGITLHGTSLSQGVENSWSIIVGGTGTDPFIGDNAIAFGALSDSGSLDHYAFAVDRSGDVAAYRNFVAGNSVLIKSGALYIGDVNNTALAYTSGILNVGHGKVNIMAGGEFTAQIGDRKYPVIHQANADTVLNGTFVKNSGDRMTGKLIMDNASIMSYKAEAAANTPPSVGNAGFWNMRVTTPAMTATYPEKRSGSLMQWGTDEDGLTQLWSPDSTHKHYIRSGNNGQWGAWGEIYTKQNKPTADEIGAVVADNGVMNSMTVRDWVKVGNVKIIANRATRTVDFIWED